MSDLISKQAAIEALKRAEALTRAFGYHNVIDTIRDLPAAEKRGRCKDCKMWATRVITKDNQKPRLGDCLNFGQMMAEDFYCNWYCADRERREEEG